MFEALRNSGSNRVIIVARLYWNGHNLFCTPAPGSLIVRPGGCPRHVGRNYVPLLCGVDTEERYYVIRDVIVI